MAQIGSWTPVHDTHAIQQAAVQITLNEPVGDVAFKRGLASIEERAAELGLLEQTSIGGFMPPELIAIGLPMPEQQGIAFARRERPDFIGERAQILKQSLRYEDFGYVRWAPFKSRAEKLLKDAAERFASVSSLNNISSEYTDVFVSLPTANADVSEVIDMNSPYVAAGSFQKTDSWHCHSGWFEPIDDHSRRLINVNIDIAENIHDGHPHRQVRIKTQTFDRFGEGPSSAAPDDISWDRMNAHLESAHVRLKDLLKDILTAEAAAAISLR